MTAAIRVAGLVKTYPGKPPVEAVRGVDLEVPAGQCFGLLGPNGAGKTTTLEVIEGLLDPTAGDVEVLGRRWATDERHLRERIGISLQETRLADKLTVRETVTLFRSFYPSGLAPDDAVAAVSLQDKADAYVVKLSGGQKQRLAVACALVGDPELVFLDEPTTGLDPNARAELWDVIRRLKARGRTVVLTTHYMDEAERLCDRVAVVDKGRVIADGPPADLIRQVCGGHAVDLTFAAAALADADLKALPTVRAVQVRENGAHLTADDPAAVLPPLLALAQRRGVPLAGLSTRRSTLDDVFHALTGHHLAD